MNIQYIQGLSQFYYTTIKKNDSEQVICMEALFCHVLKKKLNGNFQLLSQNCDIKKKKKSELQVYT